MANQRRLLLDVVSVLGIIIYWMSHVFDAGTIPYTDGVLNTGHLCDTKKWGIRQISKINKFKIVMKIHISEVHICLSRVAYIIFIMVLYQQ